jgi:hypothetical protein
MTEPSLFEKVEAIHRALKAKKIVHAFGGALALAYYAEPRATIDIDINLFVAPKQFDNVMSALSPLGVTGDIDRWLLERDGQCRIRWGYTALDFFFSYDDFHKAMRRSARTVPFSATTTIPVLGPEHLIVCKAMFDRPKDWLDIEQALVAVPHLDVEEVSRWLTRLAGPGDHRLKRFDKLAARLLGK